MTDEEFKAIFPFETPRKGQRQVIEAIIKAVEEDDKKHVCLSAPTGSGKSVIAVAVANYLGGGYLLTSQKTLQKQYDDELSLPVLYGRNHYECNLNFGKRCNQCIGHKQCKPLNKHGCQYLYARNYTLFESNISVLNYSYAMNIINSQTKYKSNELREMMPERPLLICDECIRGGQSVKTKNGNILIEDLKIGDQVYSYNTLLQKYEYKPILKTYKNLYKSSSYDEFIEIILEDGKILYVTPNHKIYTSNRGYVRADELILSDNLIVSNL